MRYVHIMEGSEGQELDLNQITFTCYTYTNQTRRWLNCPPEENGYNALVIVFATESEYYWVNQFYISFQNHHAQNSGFKVYLRIRENQPSDPSQTWIGWSSISI